MNNSKRILFLDYARIFTAFLVVYAHLYPADSGVRLYIYAFHMPLFFLISGFLHSPRTSKEELLKYFRTLFVPILFFIMVGAVIKVLFFQGNFVDILYKTLKNSTLYGHVLANGIVWFLFALLDVKLMMFFYLKVTKNRRMSAKGLFALILIWGGVVFVCRYKYMPVNPLSLKNALMAFPLYYIGFYARRYYEKADFRVPEKWKCIVYALVCLFLCVMITRINGRVSMYGFVFGHAQFPFNAVLFYLNGVIGSLMVIFVSLLFKEGNKYVAITANSLISILGFQGPIIDLIGYSGESGNYLVSIFVSAFIIIVSVALNQLFMKICPELLGKKK